MTGSHSTCNQAKIVLSVGQCGYDNGRIRQLIQGIDKTIEVRFADDRDETMQELERSGERVSLVLVNRILDSDGSSGVELIRTIKGTAGVSDVPVMLVSNFEDAQAAAVADGALPGFGKSTIGSSIVRERLETVLLNRTEPTGIDRDT